MKTYQIADELLNGQECVTVSMETAKQIRESVKEEMGYFTLQPMFFDEKSNFVYQLNMKNELSKKIFKSAS